MTPDPAKPAEPSRYERFTRLFLANQRRIYGFILASVPHVSDADDLLQETNLAMWESFDEFDHTSDDTSGSGSGSGGGGFAAWGIAIARFRVMRFFRSKSQSAARFSEATVDLLADHIADASVDVDEMHEALAACIARLEENEQTIIRERYHDDLPAKQIADRLDLSVFTLYKRLNSVYAKLLGCIQRTLSEEDAK